MKFKNIIPFIYLFVRTLVLPQPSLAQEKIKVISLIQSSERLSGKSFNYPYGKHELRLLKVKHPAVLKTPIHTHPCSNVDSCSQRKIKACTR